MSSIVNDSNSYSYMVMNRVEKNNGRSNDGSWVIKRINDNKIVDICSKYRSKSDHNSLVKDNIVVMCKYSQLE